MRRTFFLFGLLLFAISAAAFDQNSLYQSLLKTRPTNLPAGFAGVDIIPVTLSNPQKESGFIGEVDLVFKGNDPKARIGFFVFKDLNSAFEFNRKNLPPVIPGQKLLAYPPMARCADVPGPIRYCDLLIQDNAVILTAVSSTTAGGADALMGIGFKELKNVTENLARQPSPPPKPGGVDACSLVTKAEVESGLKQRVADPHADKVGGCYWSASGGDSLTIQAFATGRQGFDAAKSHSSGITHLPGIGDDAFGFVSLAGFVQIDLIRNNRYVSLTLQSQRDPSKMETAKILAMKISARL